MERCEHSCSPTMKTKRVPPSRQLSAWSIGCHGRWSPFSGMPNPVAYVLPAPALQCAAAPGAASRDARNCPARALHRGSSARTGDHPQYTGTPKYTMTVSALPARGG